MEKRKSYSTALLFLLPAGIIYLSVIVFPVLYSIYLSTFTGSGITNWTFCGINNYIMLFQDQIFLISLRNTVIWIVLTLVFSMGTALFLAVILNNQFKGRLFFRGLFYFPCVVAPIAIALIWRWVYDPDIGFINQLFNALGISYQQTWMSDIHTSLLSCFFASQWQAVGLPMILFLAGLQTVPPDVLEAASIDGASGIILFTRITVPLMKETFIMVISTLLIGSMKVYDIIFGLTNGGPGDSSSVLATYMYKQTFVYNNWGYGTTIAVVMVILMTFIIVPYIMSTTRKE